MESCGLPRGTLSGNAALLIGSSERSTARQESFAHATHLNRACLSFASSTPYDLLHLLSAEAQKIILRKCIRL
jgi:hypothetical protein